MSDKQSRKCDSFPVIYERKRPFVVDLLAAYVAGVASDATVQYSAAALGSLGASTEFVISLWGKFVDRVLGMEAMSNLQWLLEVTMRMLLPH